MEAFRDTLPIVCNGFQIKCLISSLHQKYIYWLATPLMIVSPHPREKGDTPYLYLFFDWYRLQCHGFDSLSGTHCTTVTSYDTLTDWCTGWFGAMLAERFNAVEVGGLGGAWLAVGYASCWRFLGCSLLYCGLHNGIKEYVKNKLI